MKIKLKIIVKKAAFYFLKWELPFFKKEFKLVDYFSNDVVILAYGPDVIKEGINLPALKRAAILFPGFGFNPYHNLEQREDTLKIINSSYDVVLVNPGPIQDALVNCNKIFSHPFSVDVDKLLKYKRVRKDLDSLLHLSADFPQKDWERSKKIMELTNLPFEVFPPREVKDKYITLLDRIKWRYNKYVINKISPTTAYRNTLGYADHLSTIKKYREHDGFVHIASEKPDPLYVDGKYTAALLEAGVTGAILFWHDTFKTGNDFETVYSLSKEPEIAARQILEIRSKLNIERHSDLTSKEISSRCHPQPVVNLRRQAIESIL